MAPDRKPYQGKGRGKGKSYDTGFKEDAAQTHADRAALLLAKAREANGGNEAKSNLRNVNLNPQPTPPSGSPLSSTNQQEAIALPALIKSLANPQLKGDAMSIKDAIPIAGKLARAKLNTTDKLSLLNGFILEEAGITSEAKQHKIMVAFGVRRVGSSSKEAEKGKGKSALDALSAKTTATKKRRLVDDEALSQEYGNITTPRYESGEGEQTEYIFNEILDEHIIKDRKAIINRAPIMTAWATVVLERLGFERREALSLAHCYVNTTSTARGISLGIIPASEKTKSVNFIGSNQPHFELMGIKIPLMKVGKRQEWRGISQGQVVSPDNAFNYMKRSMQQTLPAIIGSLMLLADSFTGSSSSSIKEEYQPSSGPDVLHASAYELYTQFRPSTAGEWGKKSTFLCGKALALRKGQDGGEVKLWEDIEGGGGVEDTQALEIREFERELQRLADGDGIAVKEEASSKATIKKDDLEAD